MDRLSDKLSVLGRTAVRFSHAEAARQVYDHALDAIIALTGSPRASVLLFDADAVLRFKAWRGISDGYRSGVEGHSPWVRGQREPEPILISDVSVDGSLGEFKLGIAAEGIRALAFFPLVIASGTIGKMMVYWDEPHDWLLGEAELLRTLAALTAFAIDRQRVVELLEIERGLFVGGPSVVFKWQNRPGWPVEYVSPNVQQVIGYSAEALVRGDPPYATLVHPDDLQRVADEVAAFSDQPWFEQEYRLKRADGEWRWVYDFTVTVRGPSGEVTHFLGYLLDQTDRRAEVDALNQRQRVESLGMMASGVAHDFNNLLVGVMGNASIAKQLLRNESPASLYIDDVIIAAQRASDLTKQLLAYSGHSSFELAPTELLPLVHECLRLLGSVLSSRARVDVSIPPQTFVLADGTQLRQIVMNLLTNASDALGSESGTITISSREVELTEGSAPFSPAGQTPSPGCYITLRVEDSGRGMDPSTASHVFDPFFTTKGQGRGLGLSAALGILRAHRGGVDVKSTLGQGSRFDIYLPVPGHLAEPTVRTLSERPQVSGESLRILVVDDDLSVRTVVHRLLELEGHVVTAVDNGERALELIFDDSVKWQIVLMDLTMPRMNGLEALNRLREHDPTLPVVLMTGFSKEGVASRRDDPFTQLLEKPFTSERLFEVVSSAARRVGQ